MEESFVVFANLPDFLQWLSDSNLVVNVDDTAKKRIWSHCFLQLFQVYKACRKLNREVSNLEAHILKSSARVKNAFVVYLSGNNVLFFVTIKLSHSFQRNVVALSGSTGENYFFALGTDHVCDVSSCLLTSNLSVPTILVRFGVGIAEVIGQIRKHSIKDSRVHRSCGLVVEVKRRVIIWVIHFAI